MIWRKDAHEPCARIPVPEYDCTLENWSLHPVATEEEMGIIAHLEALSRRCKRILHVGVGNSEVARRLSPKAELVHGVTINPKEKDRADSFGLERYTVCVGDKHLPETYAPFGGVLYDWIIEPSLTTYACCRWHLMSFLELLLSFLPPRGVLWTSVRTLGIRWSNQKAGGRKAQRPPPVPPMNITELKRIEADQGVTVECFGDVVAIRRRRREG